jgi:hypothetical protein
MRIFLGSATTIASQSPSRVMAMNTRPEMNTMACAAVRQSAYRDYGVGKECVESHAGCLCIRLLGSRAIDGTVDAEIQVQRKHR